MILLLLSFFSTVSTGQIGWCEYYEKIGVYRAECAQTPSPTYSSEVSVSSPRYQSINFHSFPKHDKLPVQRAAIVARSAFADFPLCRAYFHSCMSSNMCESGSVCTSGVDNRPCCTNSVSQCPNIATIGVNCNKHRSVNWCFSDSDCRSSSTSSAMCCPTGCNYNVCIHSLAPSNFLQHNQVFNRLLSQEDCPDPFSIPMQCKVRSPTSWCAKHSDCPSVNTVNPRRCCQTSCGYTACMIKYNGKWMIA